MLCHVFLPFSNVGFQKFNEKCVRCMSQEIIHKILHNHRKDKEVVAFCEIKNV